MDVKQWRLLIVDDEEGMRDLLEIVFRKQGYDVSTASTGKEALKLFEEKGFDAIVQDIRMPDMDGITLLKEIRSRAPALPVVMITAFSSWDNAVEAMRLGACDYVRKPFSTYEITTTVERVLDHRDLEQKGLADRVVEKGGFIVGGDKRMREIADYLKKIAPTDSTVFIQGESGTGKELVARFIHSRSQRAACPFISVNCAAFPENLLESELFGYKKGAFTGADNDKKGLMTLAENGTLFLDEIAEMSPATQVKLLRVIEEKTILPLGGVKEVAFNARIIAATNRNLRKHIESGQFRKDLFFRLNVIPIYLPPLRKRKDDIPLFIGHFLAKHAQKMGKEIDGISNQSKELLMRHDWPGNIRELENVIQRTVAVSSGGMINNITLRELEIMPEYPEDDPASASGAVCHAAEGGEAYGDMETGTAGALPEEGVDLDRLLEEVEKRYITQALEQSGGNMTKAARLLHLSYRSIRYKVKKLQIRQKDRDTVLP